MYWIGACAGAVLSVPVFNLKPVRALLLGEEETTKEQERVKETNDEKKNT